MKHRNAWLALAAMIPLAACADHPKAPAYTLLPAMDEAFVHQASEINLTEIALSNIESTSGQNQAVKSYAGTMITDHTTAQDRLAAIAKTHGFTLATEPNADNQKLISSLSTQKGKKLDRAYLADMVKGHHSALTLLKQESTTVSDPDLKSYVTDMDGSAQTHLADAEKLSGIRHATTRHHSRKAN